MHAVDVADRTGNHSLAALSTNRFTASEFDEFTENLATGLQVAEIAASLAFEPLDMAMALAAIAEDPGEWTAWAAALPFVPSAIRSLPATGGGRVEQGLGRDYDSVVLRNNLRRMGAEIPAKSVAHHVVGNSSKAQQMLHPVLKKLGFDLNEAANGIMLDEAFHLTLNNAAYREEIIERLRAVKDRTELDSILDEIKMELVERQEAFRAGKPWQPTTPCH